MTLTQLAKMKKSQGITAALEELASGSQETATAEHVQTLQRGLEAQSNAIVAKAAELVAKFNADQLVPDLCRAFDRFMGNAIESDKHCLAKTAIVKALHTMRSNQPQVFLLGMTCYWQARPREGQRDEAARLRVASIVAHGELGNRSELEPLIDLLVDPVSEVRHAAVQAVSAMGGREGKLVIRLKARIGDDNPGVMEQCFAGLLDEDGRHTPFVASFLDSADDAIRVSAAFALAESGDKSALEILVSSWKRTKDAQSKRDLLVAISIIRNEQARQFLCSLIADGGEDAKGAISALAAYRSNPDVRLQVEQEVLRAADLHLRRFFQGKFGE